jgi:flagellar protein FlaG
MNVNPTNSQAPRVTHASVNPSATAPPNLESTRPPTPVIEKVKLEISEKADLGFDAKETRQNLSEAIDRLNQQLKSSGRGLSFQMNEEINRPVITVHNIQTGEVVRKIPTEEVIRLAKSLEDGKGLFFNESL